MYRFPWGTDSLDCIFFSTHYVLKLFSVLVLLALTCLCYFIAKQSKTTTETSHVDGVVVSVNIEAKISIEQFLNHDIISPQRPFEREQNIQSVDLRV